MRHDSISHRGCSNPNTVITWTMKTPSIATARMPSAPGRRGKQEGASGDRAGASESATCAVIWRMVKHVVGLFGDSLVPAYRDRRQTPKIRAIGAKTKNLASRGACSRKGRKIHDLGIKVTFNAKRREIAIFSTVSRYNRLPWI